MNALAVQLFIACSMKGKTGVTLAIRASLNRGRFCSFAHNVKQLKRS